MLRCIRGMDISEAPLSISTLWVSQRCRQHFLFCWGAGLGCGGGYAFLWFPILPQEPTITHPPQRGPYTTGQEANLCETLKEIPSSTLSAFNNLNQRENYF